MSRSFSQGFGTRFGNQAGDSAPELPFPEFIFAHYKSKIASLDVQPDGIAQVFDLSGNGLTLTQPTGDQRMQYVADDGQGREAIHIGAGIEDWAGRLVADVPSWNIPTVDFPIFVATAVQRIGDVAGSTTEYVLASPENFTSGRLISYFRSSPTGQSTVGDGNTITVSFSPKPVGDCIFMHRADLVGPPIEQVAWLNHVQAAGAINNWNNGLGGWGFGDAIPNHTISANAYLYENIVYHKRYFDAADATQVLDYLVAENQMNLVQPV